MRNFEVHALVLLEFVFTVLLLSGLQLCRMQRLGKRMGVSHSNCRSRLSAKFYKSKK